MLKQIFLLKFLSNKATKRRKKMFIFLGFVCLSTGLQISINISMTDNFQSEELAGKIIMSEIMLLVIVQHNADCKSLYKTVVFTHTHTHKFWFVIFAEKLHALYHITKIVKNVQRL